MINWYNHLRWDLWMMLTIIIIDGNCLAMSFLFECLGRSYYYVADVVSLFGMMPLLVRLLGLHDMTIVILAVYCQVSL